MKISRKQLSIAAVTGAVALAGAGVASAATGVKPASLAQELAQKFHLNQSDVQNVIDNHHQEMKGYHQQMYGQRLDAAVSAGTITSAQKDLILQKQQELDTFMQGLKGKTPQERRQAMQQERQQLDQWAQQNMIPLNLFGRGFGMGHRFGWDDAGQPAPGPQPAPQQ